MLEAFATSLVLGLGGYYLLAMFMEKVAQDVTKECQFCKSRMNKEATVCPHCGRDQAS